MGVVFYSTGCPKCKILKKKLDSKGVEYEENHSVEEMLGEGLKSAPALKVDDKILLFKEAIEWVNNN